MSTKTKRLTIEEIRKELIKILDDVSSFCKENNIEYFLACGTLLGAAKYKGFIPWDDDIDIMMPRNEYERFIASYKSERYKVLNPKVTPMYFYSKVYDTKTIDIEKGIDYKKYQPLGLNIDIFPLDGIVDDSKIIKRLRLKNNKLEMFLRLSNQPIFYRKNPLKCINRIIPRIFGSKNLVKLIEDNCKSYDYRTSDYVIRYKDTINGFTGAISKDIYYPVGKLIFEEKEYNVPNKYDYWLKVFFDEKYMTVEPKPEERRVHDKEVYWK